jgi:serine/threonine protein kinase
MSVPRRLGLGGTYSPDPASRTLNQRQPIANYQNHPIRYNEDGTPASPSPNTNMGLYSPKPSPGVRVNVPSPAPASNAPAPANYSVLPALDHTHRYILTGTLQQSLFGVVKLAFDRELRVQVAVKISRRERAQQQQTRSGVSVLENVKREAAVMRYVYERSSNQLTHSHSQLSGLSTPSSFSAGGKKTKLSSRALQAAKEAASAASDAMKDDEYDLQNGRKEQGSLASDTESPHESDSETDDRSTLPGTPNSMMSASGEADEGEAYIARFIDELEDEHFHYLITEFVPAGDLYSMLTSYPQHRLSEPHARVLFRQMVLATQWLHSRNIAHLDLSLENMCLDVQDNIRLIDFGVAAIHPFTSTYYSSATAYFNYPSPTTSMTSPLPSKPGSRSFLCRPVKELYNKPGKLRYMSPELFQGLAWDAYANDVFSLGVILYSLLTGRPPFQQAEHSDVWFHVIYSGQWLTSSIRKQPSAHVYTHLSENALDLVNRIIKPQELRPTTEQILQHPWMLS